MFLCPTDRVPSGGATNYSVNFGLSPFGLEQTGPFHQQTSPLSAVTDGLSQTAAMAESQIGYSPGPRFAPGRRGLVYETPRQVRATSLGDVDRVAQNCLAVDTTTANYDWERGIGWHAGCLFTTFYQHVLPPNSLSCNNGGSVTTSLLCASSFHPGGLNVLFLDGHVRFIKETLALPTWHALGTRAGGEVVGEIP